VLITRTAFKQDSEEVDVTVNLPGRIQQFSLIAYAEVTFILERNIKMMK